MKIGNIVYYDELVNVEKVEFINYLSKDELNSIDETLPTLYIGWKSFKEFSQHENLSILDKCLIKNKIYWEFSFDEKKEDHINGINSFSRNVPIYYFSEYNYILIDPIFNNITTIKELENNIPNLITQGYCFKNEMLYLLSNKTIYGIDLKMYRYFNIDVDKIIKKIEDYSLKYLYDDGDIYEKYYKSFPIFDLLKRYMSVFLSKE